MYEVSADEQSQPEIDALPRAALLFFAEARVAMEVAPWNGDAINAAYPDAPVRTLAFGPYRQGLITYLILEDQRRVDILKVLWIG